MRLDQIVPWPEAVAGGYRATGCWRGRPLGSHLWEWADWWGGRVAVVDGARRVTYQELAARADDLAESLAGLGLEHGDPVLARLPNTWESLVLVLACLRLGVVPAPMSPGHTEAELAAVAARVGARAVVVPDTWRGRDQQGAAHRIAGAMARPAQVLVLGDRVRPDSVDLRRLVAAGAGARTRRQWLDDQAPASSDVALLLPSERVGPLGLVNRTHDDYECAVRGAAEACGFGVDTVYLAAAPACDGATLGGAGVLGVLQAGGRVVLLPSDRPRRVFAAVEAEGVTVAACTAAAAARWAGAAAGGGGGLGSLRRLHVSGGAVPAAGPTPGCRVVESYAVAEGLVCHTPADAPGGVAAGPFDELRIAGPDGAPVPDGEVGELLARGPGIPRGYYRAPALDAAAFTPDGWYRTGALARALPGRRVALRGRVAPRAEAA